MGSALVVVGGGPAALSAARAYSAASGSGRVQLFSADLHPPYNRPPMSKGYLRGESEAEDLPLEHAGFYAEQDIEVFLDRTATALEPDEARIILEGGDSVDFGQCVLATGAVPGTPTGARRGSSGTAVPPLTHRRRAAPADR